EKASCKHLREIRQLFSRRPVGFPADVPDAHRRHRVRGHRRL
ncbi:MAG: hypothetical protein AVDCRST_MAG56-8166, partial [uncultured Cytophagales bacterium]